MYINTAIITAAIQSKTVLFVCSSVNVREIRPSAIRPGPGIRRTSEKQNLITSHIFTFCTIKIQLLLLSMMIFLTIQTDLLLVNYFYLAYQMDCFDQWV